MTNETAPLPTGEQEAAVLTRLHGGTLTPLEALRELGVLRLAAVVYRLRDAGWNVQTELVKKKCRNGRTARVARYYLSNAKGGETC